MSHSNEKYHMTAQVLRGCTLIGARLLQKNSSTSWPTAWNLSTKYLTNTRQSVYIETLNLQRVHGFRFVLGFRALLD